MDSVGSMMKIRQDNEVTNRIGTVYAKIETKLSWSVKRMRSIPKTKQDNDAIAHKSVISI